MAEDGGGFLWVTDKVGIPLRELTFRFSRSSGPGGQHVNRSETRVELVFDLMGSPSLSDSQKARVSSRLSPYMDKGGVVHLVSQSTRSQLRNREEVTKRFRALMRGGLRVPRKRYATKPTRAARQKRLEEKRRRGEIKERRRKVWPGME